MSRRRLLFLALASAVVLTPLVGQSRSSRTPAARQAPAARITFAETIAPIVYANCVTCHRPGEAAPFSLISYEDVAKRGALIAKVTESRYMPPWHAEPGFGEFVGERRLTDAQIATIAAWVKQGMPRGEESEDAEAAGVSGGRLAARPTGSDSRDADRVRRAGERPGRVSQLRDPDEAHRRQVGARHRVPAERTQGRSPRDLCAGAGWQPRERRWRRRSPGVWRARCRRRHDDRDGSRASVGGPRARTPAMFTEGIVSRLPKGSDFLLQMHFHPSGKAESEKSLVGIYFAENGAPEGPCVGRSCRRCSASAPASTSRQAKSSSPSRTRSRCPATRRSTTRSRTPTTWRKR